MSLGHVYRTLWARWHAAEDQMQARFGPELLEIDVLTRALDLNECETEHVDASLEHEDGTSAGVAKRSRGKVRLLMQKRGDLERGKRADAARLRYLKDLTKDRRKAMQRLHGLLNFLWNSGEYEKNTMEHHS